jgi:hypothetical protein
MSRVPALLMLLTVSALFTVLLVKPWSAGKRAARVSAAPRVTASPSPSVDDDSDLEDAAPAGKPRYTAQAWESRQQSAAAPSPAIGSEYAPTMATNLIAP